jgi:hypothetical protein
MVQLKYWVFWITDTLGLHLGNPLGLLRSQSILGQIADFARYPIIKINGSEYATYVCGVAHVLIVVIAIAIYLPALAALVKSGPQLFRKSETPTSTSSSVDMSLAAILAAGIACGALMTLTGVNIRRYYLVVAFPLEYLFFIRLAYSEKVRASLGAVFRSPTKVLAPLWICEAMISACFVLYVHVNEGSLQGDYGKAYHLIEKERLTR